MDLRIGLLLFVGFALFYSAFMNAGYLDSTDAEERFGLLRALVERGSVLVTLRWDPVPHPVRYSPGSLLPSLPFYLGARAWTGGAPPVAGGGTLPFVRALLAAAICWSALLAPVTYGLVRRLGCSPRRAVAAALALGLTTLVFPYSKSFQVENLTGVVLAGCAWLACGGTGTTVVIRALATGLALGYALTLKTELAAVVPVYAAVFCWEAGVRAGDGSALRRRIRVLLSLAAGILPGICVCVAYNIARGGSWRYSGYVGEGFSYPLIRGLVVQFISPGKGLFWYCPVVVPALILAARLTRSHPRAGFALLGPWLVMSLVYAKWHAPAGDASLGPRFQVSYLPVILAAGFAGLPAGRAVAWRLALAIGALAGLAVQVVFSSVSFVEHGGNVKRQVPLLGWREYVEQLFFNLRFSPLSGGLEMFRDRSLDLFLVRHSPVEGGWLVHPWFPILLVAGLGLMGISFRIVASSGRRPGRFTFAGARGTSLVCVGGVLVVLAMAFTRTSWLGRGSLALQYEDSGGVFFRTWTHDLAVPRLEHDKVLVMVNAGAPCRTRWTGFLRIAEAGPHTFQVKAPNPVRLLVDGRVVLEGHRPEGTTWSSNPVELAAGTHRLEFVHEVFRTEGKMRVRITPPEGESSPLGRFLDVGPH